MYQYFLGGFGNRRFIRPQYEIMEDGWLREVDRFNEFPNGGTVSLSYVSDEDANDIKNRLLKFRIDFSTDLHPTFLPNMDNSNQYVISVMAIEEFNKDEIIEIIDIESSIDEFLNDKTKRTIRINHKPNKLILLRDDQECYGPFEFMISNIEDTYSDETYYTLKVFVNSGTINHYRYADLERIVVEGSFSIKRSDNIQYIYDLEKLNTVDSVEEIIYFDNEELADFFKNLLEKSNGIENLAEIREDFLQIADSFSESEQLTDLKIRKINELLQTSVDLRDYKVRLIEEYFTNNPNAKNDKEEYLRTHAELIDDMVRVDTQYELKTKAINSEIDDLKNQRDSILLEIAEGKEKLNLQTQELENLGELAIEKKKSELEEILAEAKQELADTMIAIEKAKNDRKQNESDRDAWKRACEVAQDEYKKATNNLNSMIVEWAANNRNSEIVKLLVSQFEMTGEEKNTACVKPISNLINSVDAEQIVTILIKKLNEAKRNVTKDEAYNYLISVVQNYITVFAGEPGTGKTSLCKLLAKSLGIYDSRFAEILVERGWTSSKDLIGYYNPLTKEVEKTQPKFSECMQQLDLENEQGIVEAPYFVLLDEANLSPIEFYWSNFNYYYDDPSKQVVSYSNGEKYEFGSELKFLATINYDQTTADLSPRFLDRAWVISMGHVSVDNIVADLIDDKEANNNSEIISLEALNQAFAWQNFKDKRMNPITRNRLNLIVDKMKEGGHSISARSLHSIVHYYLVAEEYMSSKEVALDFAIAQKILPCINGNGKKYGEFLNGLMGICKENQLNRSASLIAKIRERAEHEFYGFFNL